MLTDRDFFQFALKHYDSPSCRTAEEFNDDLQRFTHIKKALNKDNPDVEVILNNIRIQYNLFQHEACTEILFFRCNKESWSKLKPFLIYLSYLRSDDHLDVPIDQSIVKELRCL